MALSFREKKDCAYDAISLGEIMLRLDPGRAGFVPPGSSRFGKAAESTMWCGDFDAVSL